MTKRIRTMPSMIDTDKQARIARIRAVIAAEIKAYDQATRQLADAEYALFQLIDSPEWDSLPDYNREQRHDALRRAVEQARKVEREADIAWRAAYDRADAEVK